MTETFIDKIYVINLDHRTDRLAGFMKNMEDVGLSHLVERFPATYVKEFGTLGNTISFINLLQNIVSANHTHSMICEDDFRFKNKTEVLEWFAHMNKTIPTLDYDVVSLSGNSWVRSFSVEVTEHSHLKRVKCLQALSGFIVNKPFAPTLLASMKECKIKLEETRNTVQYSGDQYLKKLQPICNWFLSNPILGHQEPSYSDLVHAHVNYRC